MPRGDRRGPAGAGPRTGRGLGLCAGYDSPDFSRSRDGGRWGAGFGPGRGGGQGMGSNRRLGQGFRARGYVPTYPQESFSEPTAKEERSYLERSVEALEKELASLRDRLREMTGEKK